MNICIIPARGGSKRISRKNIKQFYGKPIIAKAINTAKQSNCFDKIIVSTDDKEIAQISKEYGAEIPFIRPDKLSDDYTTTNDVINHSINWFKRNKIKPKIVCCLYPTAVFIEKEDLQKAMKNIDFLKSQNFVISAVKYTPPIQRALKIDQKTGLSYMQYPENFKKRTQDLDDSYHDAGQFYCANAKTWLSKKNIFEGCKLCFINSVFVQDIDTEEDWLKAELLYSVMQSKDHLFISE